LEEEKMKFLCKIIGVLFLTVLLSAPGLATNGDNLIGVGPVSRAMGGVGIAAPQDAISAVFSNPAAMCFGPYCPSSHVDFAGTLFMPDVKASVTGALGQPKIKADSEDEVYSIPAFGLSVPITDGLSPPDWRFGLAAYGVTGLGVDYRTSDLDQPTYFPFTMAGAPSDGPLITGEYTQLQSMRFAPAFGFQPNARLSFGLAGIIEYANLDLGQGSDWTYGFGVQGGAIFKPINELSLGLNIITPRKLNFKNVADFDNSGSLDDLDLEAPLEIGGGAAYAFSKLLIEADVKWIDWSDADGYKDFDWNDQWVFAIGAQYQPIPKLFVRAGYNYAKTPVEDNDGFNGMATKKVQGKTIPSQYYYETFRLIGFPALAEHHITLGIGYEFTQRFSVNLGYMHAFKNDLSETGTDPFGNDVKIESELTENAIDLGLTWLF
jgi:long-chain fatty acid transport protein